MKKAFVLFGLICILCYSCSEEANRTIIGSKANYGDTVVLSIPEPIQTLHPLYNSDLYTHRILNNIFEPLFEIDEKRQQVIPRVAEKYRWMNDHTTLRVYLKKGIYFHEDPCFNSSENELTATDVKFTLEMACSQNEINRSNDALLGKIKGADVFFENPQVKSVSGITIINPYCIDIALTGKYAHFPQLLTSSKYGICSKIAYNYYKTNIIKHPVGTGPFMLASINKKEVLLKYNPQYWRKDAYGNTYPYLNALRFHVIPTEKEDVKAFKNEQIDLLCEVSPQYINDIFYDFNETRRKKPFPHKVMVISGSRVSMLVLNQNLACFNDARVRKAIDLIIDRDRIAYDLLNGDGLPATQGFAPPSPYYHNNELPLKKVNAVLAKQLFHQAGYGGTTPFPVLNFYIAGSNSEQAVKYCRYIATQLKRILNIDTKINLVELTERYDAAVSNKAAIWKLGWSPDYPDPEAYFSLFYSKNPTNKAQNPLFPKINSAIYDFNYNLGMEESDNGLRNNYFANCDQILQEENWVLPILYEDFVFVFNLRVRGIKTSQIGLFDFTETYIKPL